MDIIAANMTTDWIRSVYDSPERLSSIIVYANWVIFITLVLTALCSLVLIVAGGRKDALLAEIERKKDATIAEAKAKSTDANDKAAQAIERAGVANERAAQLALEAEQLRLQAEREKLKRAEIERKIAPRRLVGAEAEALSAALRPFAGTEIVISVLNAPEPERFAQDMSRAIITGGLKVMSLESFLAMGPVKPGIGLHVPPDKESVAFGIAQVLVQAGLAQPPIARWNVDLGKPLKLQIGPKPD